MTKNSIINDEYDELATPGTVVVGSYTETGKPKTPTKMLGNQEIITKLNQRLAAESEHNGGIPISSKKKKVKNVEINESRFINLPVKSKTKTIVFNTQIGKIRVNTVGVLTCDHAICLIISRDELKYEPSLGYNCELIIDEETYPVAYFGFKFNWPDSDNILMIFVINRENNNHDSE
jgi:hypothetical protein